MTGLLLSNLYSSISFLMVVGKTIQALASTVLFQTDWPVLVVCPSSARYHWRAEILNWLLPEFVFSESDVIMVESSRLSDLPKRGEIASFKFMIISYSLVPKLRAPLLDFQFKFAIVDESHYLKNPHAQRTVCLDAIIRQATRAILLSGTPALSRYKCSAF